MSKFGIKDEIVTIFRHNKEVIAVNEGMQGVAKCHPDDEFNFEVGAKLALERLFEIKNNKGIKQGEIVKIRDLGYLCPYAIKWVTENIHNPEFVCRYAFGDSLGFDAHNNKLQSVENKRFRVVEIVDNMAFIEQLHTDEGIDCGFFTSCYLIYIKGLEVVK